MKELIQNADDAGAREVCICLDCREHSTKNLSAKSLIELQGLSLLCYNNAVFTETDFQSITRIGDSSKKETSKGTKTGRFGIGFNSVYHLSEVPTFVSDSRIVYFDPQRSWHKN